MRRVDYVILYVDELSRSIEFYRDTVGLELKFASLDTGYAEFVTEGCKFGLYSKKLLRGLIGTDAGVGPSAAVVFIVDNVDEHAERLVSQRVEILSGPTDRDWGHRTLHFLDPDGNVVEFAQEIPRREARS